MTDQHEGRGTERVESQRRLAPTEGAELATHSSGVVLHQLLAAAETMQLGVIIADGFGTILYANPAQARMYGVDTPDEIIGGDVTIFCLSGQRDPLMGRRLGPPFASEGSNTDLRAGHPPSFGGGRLLVQGGARRTPLRQGSSSCCGPLALGDDA